MGIYKFLLKVLFVYLIFGLTFVFAQTSNYYKFVLKDSSNIVGFITFENQNIIQIKTLSGNEIRINQQDIISKQFVDISKDDLAHADSTTSFKNQNVFSEQLDSTVTIRLELKDGSSLIGKIESEDSTSISFNLLSNAIIQIEKSTIINREIVSSKIQNGEYWIEDPNKTRLFFAPTGHGLKSGKGYFSVYEIFFPMVAFGMYDYVTISGGMSLFPGSSEQLIYLAPKITPFQNEQFAISVGDFFVTFPDNSDDYLNILYSVGTISFSKGAITLGAGYETSSKNPIFLIGGELRISRYAKLITENWFIANTDFNFMSLGFRFLGEHLAADFAFVIPLIDSNDIVLIPWIGFAYNF